ncbi:hypothetical protein [Streptomyces yangpuensis]|uniref:hypothetical protein n=1 Tax=Streptomyces yangpuensis TaxID=1648182 RepID=UPI0035E0EE08
MSAAERCGDLSDPSSGSWRFGSVVDDPVDRGAYLQLTFSGTDCMVPGCEYDEYLSRVTPAATP